MVETSVCAERLLIGRVSPPALQVVRIPFDDCSCVRGCTEQVTCPSLVRGEAYSVEPFDW